MGAGLIHNDHDGTPVRLTERLYLILIASLPINHPFTAKFLGLPVQAADLIFLATAVAWLASLVRSRRNVRRSGFYLPLGIYLAAVVCSALVSQDPRASTFKLLGKTYLVGLSVLSLNLVTSLEFLRRVVSAWLVGTSIVVTLSVLGIVLFYLGVKDHSINFVLHFTYGSLPPGNYPRVQGLFQYPAMLCNYLSVSFMFALMAYSAGWLPARRFWPLIVGMGITDLFTLTPGLGGLGLSVGLWVWLQLTKAGRPGFARSVFVTGAVAAAAFFAASCVTLFPHRPEHEGATRFEARASPRALAWRGALRTFEENPFFGRGVGLDVCSVYYQVPSGEVQSAGDAHNTYLNVAGETGLAGLFGLLYVLTYVLKSCRPSDVHGAVRRVILVCLGLALIDAFLYQSLTGSYEDMRHLWVLFGLVVAAKAISYGGKAAPATVVG